MLETAISLLEFYPKEKKTRQSQRVIYEDIHCSIFKIVKKKKKKEGPIKSLMNI